MDNNNLVCSFFGHFEIDETEELTTHLSNLIELLITKENISIFYFGGLGQFDDLCYRIVSKFKLKYHHIKRIFCFYDEKHLKKSKQPLWLKNEEYEDYIYFHLKFDSWRTRIYYRNIEIVERSNFIVFYVNNFINSGAYKILKYAKLKKKNYINITQ